MTPTAAEGLAVRICQTWPKSPPVDVWVEDIIDLDEGAAGTAFARLRRDSEYAPSIAKFRATVKSLRTVDLGNRPDPCWQCRDSGWIEASDYVEDNGGQPITYSQVKPCHCPEGSARAESAVWRGRQGHAA